MGIHLCASARFQPKNTLTSLYATSKWSYLFVKRCGTHLVIETVTKPRGLIKTDHFGEENEKDTCSTHTRDDHDVRLDIQLRWNHHQRCREPQDRMHRDEERWDHHLQHSGHHHL